ncbi:MAG: hypothetical protein JW709_11850 [Sedimentisphaerales bacterium]|nr:hypothetical protein [Sedimentisphaerales bacterium]
MKTRVLLLTSITILLAFALCTQAAIKYVTYNDEQPNGSYTKKLIPYYLWACGCTPTSGSMTLAYWDNYGPIGGGSWGKYTSWGRLIRYYIDEPTLESYEDGDGDNFVWGHYASAGLARTMTCVDLAWHMDTDAPGGSTDRDDQHTGINSYTNSIGYGSSWATRYYKFWPWDPAVYKKIRTEIDNGYPCLCSIPGHSVCCWGYDSGADTIFTYDTWNEYRHDWDEDEFENLNRVHPQNGTPDKDVDLHTPDGGETWGDGTQHTIQWYQYGSAIDNVDLFYSTNGGLTWTNIVTYYTSSAGWNSYTWTVPSGLNSTRMRVKIDGWTGWNDLYSEDATQTNFTVN